MVLAGASETNTLFTSVAAQPGRLDDEDGTFIVEVFDAELGAVLAHEACVGGLDLGAGAHKAILGHSTRKWAYPSADASGRAISWQTTMAAEGWKKQLPASSSRP